MSHLLPVNTSPAPVTWIEKIHDREYIRRVETSCARGDMIVDSMDTMISEGSYGAALLAAGAALALCDAVAGGVASAGFSPVRPPGHHAERNKALGFCLFNNVAIAARYLQERHGLRRVLIVDWDVHHGNGTQHTFEEDPEVFYFSTHQYPWYPGTGAANERGVGKGLGATLNVPMPAGAGDEAYRRAFTERLVPAAAKFRPQVVLISAGFDAHQDDPLSHILLTDRMYGEMTRIILGIVRDAGAAGVVSLLEGGYHPIAMPAGVEHHVRALLEG